MEEEDCADPTPDVNEGKLGKRDAGAESETDVVASDLVSVLADGIVGFSEREVGAWTVEAPIAEGSFSPKVGTGILLAVGKLSEEGRVRALGNLTPAGGNAV